MTLVILPWAIVQSDALSMEMTSSAYRLSERWLSFASDRKRRRYRSS
jgi:hypothetical protein